MFSALFRRDDSGDEAPRSYDVEAPRSRGSRSRGSRSRSRSPSSEAEAGFEARALYSFEAESEAELSFAPGELLRVYPHVLCEPGWWMGGLRGRRGLVPCSYLQPLAPHGASNASSGSVERCCSPVTSQRASPRALAHEHPHERGRRAQAGSHPVGGDLGRALGCSAAASPDPRSVRTDQVKALEYGTAALLPRHPAVPPLPPPPPQPAWARAWPRPHSAPPHSLEGGARGGVVGLLRSRAAHAQASIADAASRERSSDRAYDDPWAPPRPEQLQPMSQRPSPATEPAASRARPRTLTPLPHTFAAAANAPTLHGHGDPPYQARRPPAPHEQRDGRASEAAARAQAQQQSSAEGASSRGRCAQLRALPQLSAPAGAAPAQKGNAQEGHEHAQRLALEVSSRVSVHQLRCEQWHVLYDFEPEESDEVGPARSRARARLVRSCSSARRVAGCADRGRRRDRVRGRGHARRFPPRRLPPRPLRSATPVIPARTHAPRSGSADGWLFVCTPGVGAGLAPSAFLIPV